MFRKLKKLSALQACEVKPLRLVDELTSRQETNGFLIFV